jgi:hypothetical protein
LVLWGLSLLPSVRSLDLEFDGSIPETFEYLKWTACIVGSLWLFERRDFQPLYLLWAILFLYLLIDDILGIHENVGAWLSDLMNWQPAFALRAIDFGELAVTCFSSVILLGPIVLAYWLSRDDVAKSFCRRMMFWLIALAFFGVGVDMLHIVVSSWSATLSGIVGAVEDGGEMLMASLLTYTVWREVLAERTAQRNLAKLAA